jgi:hypothetical protein
MNRLGARGSRRGRFQSGNGALNQSRAACRGRPGSGPAHHLASRTPTWAHSLGLEGLHGRHATLRLPQFASSPRRSRQGGILSRSSVASSLSSCAIVVALPPTPSRPPHRRDPLKPDVSLVGSLSHGKGHIGHPNLARVKHSPWPPSG